jgi:uncharacterized repeat protein (TIGR03843 family)
MTQTPDPKRADSTPLTVAQVLQTLGRGVIQEEHGLLPWGSNYAYLVPVTDDERTVLAVYKPQRGERPLWDFPDGTLCQREVAAFIVSEALGWQIVPPTVLRAGPYGLGSAQFYVEHDPEVNYFSPFPAECRDQLQRVAAFDYIINNADRKGGHCLRDGQGHVWGIDHGISFHRAPKLRTVIWEYAGEPLPAQIAQDLVELCETLSQSSLLIQALSELLSEQEVMAFRKRVERLSDARVFPQPGPGPNYPWPPV